jgi:hypothetical protein
MYLKVLSIMSPMFIIFAAYKVNEEQRHEELHASFVEEHDSEHKTRTYRLHQPLYQVGGIFEHDSSVPHQAQCEERGPRGCGG